MLHFKSCWPTLACTIPCIGLDWFVNGGGGYGCKWCGHPWSWFVVQVGCVSFGGLDVWSKVTHFSVIGGVASSGMVVVGDGILFNSASIFWSALISNVPLCFSFPLGCVLGHSMLSQLYPPGLWWVVWCVYVWNVPCLTLFHSLCVSHILRGIDGPEGRHNYLPQQQCTSRRILSVRYELIASRSLC